MHNNTRKENTMKNKQPPEWAQNLKKERYRSMMQATKLADELQVSRQFVYLMENGKVDIPDTRFTQIARIFGVDPDDMFPGWSN